MNDKQTCINMLRNHGLLPTKQRISLFQILFSGENMHFCAEDLKKIVSKKGNKMSLATIYNNLQSFAEVGILKQRRVTKNKAYFDNNVTDHYHFYDEENDKLIDIASTSVKFQKFPKIPGNKYIKSIDLIINLKRNKS